MKKYLVSYICSWVTVLESNDLWTLNTFINNEFNHRMYRRLLLNLTKVHTYLIFIYEMWKAIRFPYSFLVATLNIYILLDNRWTSINILYSVDIMSCSWDLKWGTLTKCGSIDSVRNDIKYFEIQEAIPSSDLLSGICTKCIYPARCWQFLSKYSIMKCKYLFHRIVVAILLWFIITSYCILRTAWSECLGNVCFFKIANTFFVMTINLNTTDFLMDCPI